MISLNDKIKDYDDGDIRKRARKLKSVTIESKRNSEKRDKKMYISFCKNFNSMNKSNLCNNVV